MKDIETVAIEDDAKDPKDVICRARLLNDGTMFRIYYWPHLRANTGGN